MRGIMLHMIRISNHYSCTKNVETLPHGRKFELRIDHCGLKHLFGQPTLNSKQTRWLEFLSEYDFEIKHIKGKENQVVDALSRRVHEMHIATISMYRTDLKDKILEATNSDQHYLQIKVHYSKEICNRNLNILS
jgi:hypothetical protein